MLLEFHRIYGTLAFDAFEDDGIVYEAAVTALQTDFKNVWFVYIYVVLDYHTSRHRVWLLCW